MIMAKRLVSLLNSSISGNLFELESKEIGDFIDKYFTGANLMHKMKLSAKKLTTEAMFSSQSLSPLPPNLMYQCVLTMTNWKN